MTFNPGDRVRLIESFNSELPAGATAVVTNSDGMFTEIRWEPPRDTRVTSLYTRRFERVDDDQPSTKPTTVEEWQKKWTDLVLAAHRIADDHGMCSSFEQNVADLGIPPRHRHRSAVNFNDQGFETPDLVIEETETEYCVYTRRTVQITVPVTVTVTQAGHGHYSGGEEPDETLLDWGEVDWEEIDVDHIAQALYDSTLSDLRYAVHLDGDEEVTPNEGDEEIVDWEVPE